VNTLETIAQIGISTLGILALFLVAQKNKWGFVFGLASTPFWFITAIINRQWGIVILNIVYTVGWIYGVWRWFFKPKKRRTPLKPLLYELFYPNTKNILLFYPDKDA